MSYPVAICVCSYGSAEWATLAERRALPSARLQQAAQLISLHDNEGTACWTRNAAAKAANADWLCFLDADDELGPGYLQALEPWYGQEVLLAPYVIYVRADGTRTAAHIPNAGNWPYTNDAVSGTLIRRQLFERLGGWRQEFWPWSDWELWLRAAAQGVGRIHVPEAVYVAHQSASGENARLSRSQGLRLHARVRHLYQDQFV